MNITNRFRAMLVLAGLVVLPLVSALSVVGESRTADPDRRVRSKRLCDSASPE